MVVKRTRKSLDEFWLLFSPRKFVLFFENTWFGILQLEAGSSIHVFALLKSILEMILRMFLDGTRRVFITFHLPNASWIQRRYRESFWLTSDWENVPVECCTKMACKRFEFNMALGVVRCCPDCMWYVQWFFLYMASCPSIETEPATSNCCTGYGFLIYLWDLYTTKCDISQRLWIGRVLSWFPTTARAARPPSMVSQPIENERIY